MVSVVVQQVRRWCTADPSMPDLLFAGVPLPPSAPHDSVSVLPQNVSVPTTASLKSQLAFVQAVKPVFLDKLHVLSSSAPCCPQYKLALYVDKVPYIAT